MYYFKIMRDGKHICSLPGDTPQQVSSFCEEMKLVEPGNYAFDFDRQAPNSLPEFVRVVQYDDHWEPNDEGGATLKGANQIEGYAYLINHSLYDNNLQPYPKIRKNLFWSPMEKGKVWKDWPDEYDQCPLCGNRLFVKTQPHFDTGEIQDGDAVICATIDCEFFGHMAADGNTALLTHEF